MLLAIYGTLVVKTSVHVVVILDTGTRTVDPATCQMPLGRRCAVRLRERHTVAMRRLASCERMATLRPAGASASATVSAPFSADRER